MVSCIQYETDKEVLSDDTDAWATPRFFLDIKKGDEEDHAILLCNLFLGLSMDAYVCIGHGKVVAVDEFTDEETIQATDEQHVWVMTRPADGSIVFWECMKTKDYPLLKRWKGEDGDDDETDEEDEANNQEDEGDDDDDMKFSAFYEDDIMLKDNQIHAPDIFMDDQGMMGRRDDDSSGEEEDLFLLKPNVIPPYHSIHVVFNHENIWANMQSLDPTNCLYEIDDAEAWKPFCSFEEGFSPDAEDLNPYYKAPPIPTRLKKERCAKQRTDILIAVKDGVRELRIAAMLDPECIHEPDPKDKKGAAKHMQGQLCSGLSLMEDRLLANDERKQDNITARLKTWKGNLIKSAPPNTSFEGIPVNFSFPEPKKINKRICEKYFEFLSDQDQDVKYCFGCHVAPYYCTVQSIWVYITKIKPLGDNDSDDEE